MTSPKKQSKKSKPVPTNFDQLPASAQVPARTVAALLDVSEVTVWRWAKSGKLPAPRRFGEGTTRFNVGELREAISKLAA